MSDKAHWKNWKDTGKHRKWKVRNKTGELLYADLTERIIGFCYEIHSKYGSGQKETLYQNLLEEKFSVNDIHYAKEKQISIKSDETGRIIGNHRLDFVIYNKVVVETKAIKFTPNKIEQQLFSYLRNSPYKVGLMINFGSQKLYVRRLILT